MPEKFDVIIIGGGLSGLLSASLLSRKGLKICILEKNKNTGGMIQSFNREGISFDTGMNFFGAFEKGQIQNELFKSFGIADKTDITKISNFELVTKNGKYKIPNNFERFENQLISYFPEEKKGIKIFLKEIKEIFYHISFESGFENLSFLKYYEQSTLEFINSVTKNRELAELLKFNNLLFGSNLETTPLYIYAVITGSFLQSAGTFTNGSKQFIEVSENEILNNKGTILTKKEVEKIITRNDYISHCVCNDGTTYFADTFLSTLHPQNIIPKIQSPLLKTFYRKRIAGLSNSKASLIINVILKKRTVLFENKPKFINTEGKSVLFYFPVSGKNGDYADTAKIMVKDTIAFYSQWADTKVNKRSESYRLYKNERAKEIFNFIEKYFPGFKENIHNYFVSTPLTFRDYTGSPEGSSYGILKDYSKPSETIFSVNTKFKNLFLTGQSINFHGLLGVSITSSIACSVLTKYISNRKINQ